MNREEFDDIVWHSAREATVREQRWFLREWPCVCARCFICQLILFTNWEEEE